MRESRGRIIVVGEGVDIEDFILIRGMVEGRWLLLGSLGACEDPFQFFSFVFVEVTAWVEEGLTTLKPTCNFFFIFL